MGRLPALLVSLLACSTVHNISEDTVVSIEFQYIASGFLSVVGVIQKKRIIPLTRSVIAGIFIGIV
jgi:hypothetical protein